MILTLSYNVTPILLDFHYTNGQRQKMLTHGFSFYTGLTTKPFIKSLSNFNRNLNFFLSFLVLPEVDVNLRIFYWNTQCMLLYF